MRVPRRLTRVLARTKPVVPDRAWPILLALRSMPGDAALIGEPPFRSAAVVAAHPDDESLGCAGTLALLRRRGTPVTVAFATDGEATRGAPTPPAETARRRRGEAVAACAALGIDDVRFWGMPDGGLPERIPELASHLAQLVGEHDGLLLPWFLDGHPDHEALSAALADAVVPRHLEVWGYETWTPLPANRIVDISGVWEEKRAALACHASGDESFDLSAHLALHRWRSIFGLDGRGHAEAFSVLDPSDFRRLGESVRS